VRIGLFGLFGGGNLGNDGCLEAALGYLREHHPDAELACLCAGPDVVAARFGISTTPVYWYSERQRRPVLPLRVGLKAVGKVRDWVRMVRWVRRQDVVVVPGTGVLENTLPLHPWGFPFSVFLLCLSGRLTGTKVALVNVGASVVEQRALRMLYRWAARLAHYRSFRDQLSRDAVAAMGVSGTDEVYPDLAFALPAPPAVVEPGTVGVGVMDFHGGTGERHVGERIHLSYVDAMARFVRRLLAEGRRVRLLIGDEPDRAVVAKIIDDVRAHPDLDPSAVVFEPVATVGELMRQIAGLDAVVGTRYHNVLCALKLAKPTVAVTYSAKGERLMAEMGLAELCQDARAVDVDLLVEQLHEVERRADRIRPMLAERSAARAAELEHQYEVLSSTLFGAPASAPALVRRAS
jgi:polysaccharide pyruvyl transferase WcaK-like protein